MEAIEIRRPVKEEAEAINSLIIDVFLKCVAPEYSDEGVAFFLNLCNVNEIRDKIINDNQLFIALSKQDIIGVIWTRETNHMSRFFISVSYQRQGVGRMLFNYFIEDLKCKHTGPHNITVYSSPFAIGAYEKLGFIATDKEQIRNGMKYIPMIYSIT